MHFKAPLLHARQFGEGGGGGQGGQGVEGVEGGGGEEGRNCDMTHLFEGLTRAVTVRSYLSDVSSH